MIPLIKNIYNELLRQAKLIKHIECYYIKYPASVLKYPDSIYRLDTRWPSDLFYIKYGIFK